MGIEITNQETQRGDRHFDDLGRKFWIKEYARFGAGFIKVENNGSSYKHGNKYSAFIQGWRMIFICVIPQCSINFSTNLNDSYNIKTIGLKFWDKICIASEVAVRKGC